MIIQNNLSEFSISKSKKKGKLSHPPKKPTIPIKKPRNNILEYLFYDAAVVSAFVSIMIL